jgi:DNA-directed RNA polymerase specialized sigma24 family protein
MSEEQVAAFDVEEDPIDTCYQDEGTTRQLLAKEDREIFLQKIRLDLPVAVTEELEVLPSRVLRQAKELAQQHYVDGYSIAETARFAGVTFATIVDWLGLSLVKRPADLTPSQRRYLRSWRLPQRAC